MVYTTSVSSETPGPYDRFFARDMYYTGWLAGVAWRGVGWRACDREREAVLWEIGTMEVSKRGHWSETHLPRESCPKSYPARGYQIPCLVLCFPSKDWIRGAGANLISFPLRCISDAASTTCPCPCSLWGLPALPTPPSPLPPRPKNEKKKKRLNARETRGQFSPQIQHITNSQVPPSSQTKHTVPVPVPHPYTQHNPNNQPIAHRTAAHHILLHEIQIE